MQRRLLRELFDAIEQSDLPDKDKRQLRRVLRWRRRVRQFVLDQVTAEVIAEGYVEFDAAENVDWTGIIAFLQELIPLILLIIDLFGQGDD